MNTGVRVIAAGLGGGFLGNGVLGVAFSNSLVHALLYDPARQSELFIAVTPTRNIPVSVAGLVVLSVIHAWLFWVLRSAIPGKTWFRNGLFWGLSIWLMYWVFQEWFIYHTLLREPWLLNLLELAILLAGSLVEGVVIAFLLARPESGRAKGVTASLDLPGIVAPPPAIFALAFLIGLGAHWRVPLPLFSWPIDAVVGWPLVGAGAVLLAWAVSSMRRAHTSVNPYRPSSTVVVDGPYRWSRNPIYLGMTAGYTGAALLVGSAWPLVLLPPVLIVMTYGVIAREERYLERVFGEAYRTYRRQVRRWC